MNKDLATSVRARLLNLAKAQGADFNQVLVRFALERTRSCNFRDFGPMNSQCQRSRLRQVV